MFVDDNGISCFVDDNGVTCWVDDNGIQLCCGAQPTTTTDNPRPRMRRFHYYASQWAIVLFLIGTLLHGT